MCFGTFGPLMVEGGGGCPQSRLSILRNGNVLCLYFSNFHVDLKIAQWHLSNLRNTLIFFLGVDIYMSIYGSCRPVEFKGQGPFYF